MTTDTGPIYGVPLIDTFPLGEGGMLQQMPSRHDLVWCQDVNAYRVAAGYEVLLAHYHRVCEERDRLRALLREIHEWDLDYPSLAQGIADRTAKEIAP